MFFIVSKLFWFVAAPLNLFVLLSLLGCIMIVARFKRSGRVVLAIGLVSLAISCFSPLGALLIRPLEDRFPPPPKDMAAPAGIIVLGGALDEGLSQARNSPALLQAGSRLTAGVELARRYPQARLIFTGGSASLRGKGLGEAAGVRDLWLSLGVPQERMIFEEKSRNTWENAIFTRDMIGAKPGETYLLVTSAWHMPRSMGIFRHVGFDVVPYPVDYRTFGDNRDFRPDPVATEQFSRLDFAIHEWIGLAAYWMTGKSDALFPAPEQQSDGVAPSLTARSANRS